MGSLFIWTWRPLVMDYDLLHFTIYACLYACAIYFNLLIGWGSIPCLFYFQMVHLWNKVGQSGESWCLPTARRRPSVIITPPPTFPSLDMSVKQPAHRRKGGSVEVVDSKYAVDLATQQSYSENVFLFVPNLIG